MFLPIPSSISEFCLSEGYRDPKDTENSMSSYPFFMVIVVQIYIYIIMVIIYLLQNLILRAQFGLVNKGLMIQFYYSKVKTHQHMELSNQYEPNMTKSLPVKSNFFKEVIRPTIYANQNFHIILNNYSEPKPEPLATRAKKNKIQAVVERIISKKPAQSFKKKAYYEHRSSKISKLPKNKQKTNPATYQLDNMTMDIDERINEKALYVDEEIKSYLNILDDIFEKVGYPQNKPKQSQKESADEINFYLTSISPTKTKSKESAKVYVQPENVREVKGWVEEQVEKNKKWQRSKTCNSTSAIKTRPQTAKNFSRISTVSQTNRLSLISRPNSLTNFKLKRYETGRDVEENLNRKTKNSDERRKLSQLTENIENENLQFTMCKPEMKNILHRLGGMWKTQQQFLESKPSTTLMKTKQSTLQKLQAKRTKQSALLRLDSDHLEKS